MDYRVTFPCGSERAIGLLEQDLTRRGLTVLRSFEISGSKDGACTCGSHGGEPCTCLFAVLLVFGAPGEPAVVTARSYNGEVTLELAVNPNAAVDGRLAESTLEALHTSARTARNGRHVREA